MAIAQATALATTGYVHMPITTSVYARWAWTDTWTWIPYAWAENVVEAAPPAESYADIIFDYGNIRRNDWPALAVVDPIDLEYAYLAVWIHTPWSTAPLCVGMVDSQTFRPQGSQAMPGGRIKIRAYGLEQTILDRVELMRTYGPNGWIDRAAIFNYARARGRRLSGNRSESPDANGLYYFDATETPWSNLDIIHYLLGR
jgi:hypothetical protein